MSAATPPGGAGEPTPRREPAASVPDGRGGTEQHVPGAARQTDLGNAVIAYLIAGPLTFGGLGLLGDRVLDTAFLMPVGVVAGMVLSLYVIWLRYGRS